MDDADEAGPDDARPELVELPHEAELTSCGSAPLRGLGPAAHDPFRAPYVLASLGPGSCRVLRPDRVDDRHVELGEILLVPERPVDRERRGDLDPEHEPALEQRLVVRQLDHRAMEGDVVRGLRPPVLTGCRVSHRLQLALERADVAAGLPGGLPRGETLEGGAHRKDRQELRVVDRAHSRTAKRLGLDESQELKVAERFAHRRLARAELACQASLDKPLSRLELAAQDALEEDLLDLIAEDGARDRHGLNPRRPDS